MREYPTAVPRPGQTRLRGRFERKRLWWSPGQDWLRRVRTTRLLPWPRWALRYDACPMLGARARWLWLGPVWVSWIEFDPRPRRGA